MRRILMVFLLLLPTAGWTQRTCYFADTTWQRMGDPVLRDPIAGENYEVASDSHAIVSADGNLHMFYSGDDSGNIAIKYAKGSDMATWQPHVTVLGRSTDHAAPMNMETPFYRLSDTGEHQLYFIGYADEATYEASIYLAIAPEISGPYIILDDPVMPRGAIDGKDVHLVTSPSVLMHDGVLHMAFLGWNGFDDVTKVWALGATSTDDGRTWDEIREIDAPIGMEGQISQLPQGGFVAVHTTEWDGVKGIRAQCAAHPFGPYDAHFGPVMSLAGPPWEVDEIIAPQITFDPVTEEPNLFYTGADHLKGWWIMRAVPTY